MSVLVDTNILLRSIEPLRPQHAVAVGAVSQLLAESTPVYFTLQNIAEFLERGDPPGCKQRSWSVDPFNAG